MLSDLELVGEPAARARAQTPPPLCLLSIEPYFLLNQSVPPGQRAGKKPCQGTGNCIAFQCTAPDHVTDMSNPTFPSEHSAVTKWAGGSGRNTMKNPGLHLRD